MSVYPDCCFQRYPATLSILSDVNNKVLLDKFLLDYGQKHASKGAFWNFIIFKILSRNPTADGAFEIIDVSRLCLQVTSGEVLGMAQNATTVTVMEKSRLRRK